LLIKTIGLSGIPDWISLSKEYDKYVLEIAPDLTGWYDGGENSVSFEGYMLAKINKDEAFMAASEYGDCRGIVAISRTNNNITFFGISHNHDFHSTGDLLLRHALSQLDLDRSIKINILKSDAEHIQKEYRLLSEYGFAYISDGLEKGVPVKCMERKPIA